MNQKKLPRKINILAAILILLVGVFIGGYLVLKSGKISAGELSDILSGQSISPSICQPDVNDSAKDSDNDGLKDWQEIQLYKTDPCKQDSDGDGYFDGEEAASGYDPAKKAPGDELPGTMPKSPRPLPNNLTIALQQKLSEQLRQDKISPIDASGNLLSSQELEQFPGVQQAVWEVTQHKDQIFAPEPINDSELKISNDNRPSAIALYTKKIGEALTRQSSKIIDSEKTEAQVFLEAVQNNNFSELNLALADHQNIYQKFKEVTVPSDFLELHKQQLNILSSLIIVYQSIANVQADPLKATLALQQYLEILSQMIGWGQKFQTTIQTHS